MKSPLQVQVSLDLPPLSNPFGKETKTCTWCQKESLTTRKPWIKTCVVCHALGLPTKRLKKKT